MNIKSSQTLVEEAKKSIKTISASEAKKLLDEQTYIMSLGEEQELNKEFEDFKNSQEYVAKVNEEFNLHKSKYSDAEVDNAIKYAFECIQLPPEEIGINVYQKLWRQHFYEILNS